MKTLLAALAISTMGLASVASAQAVPAENTNANSLGGTAGLTAAGAALGVLLVVALFASDDDDAGTTTVTPASR